MDSAYMLSVVIGSILMGAVIGAVPAISGAVKGRLGIGLGGFAACIICNFILGLILSIPACAVFMFFIFRKPKEM